MNGLRVKDYSSSPANFDLRGLLGGLLQADWRQALIARGFGWNAIVGGFSGGTDTGIVGGGNGTIMDIDQPEFVISVPSGYAMIPLEFNIEVRPGLQTTDSHVTDILVAADIAAKYDGTGTVTTEAPSNMRTNHSASCPLTVVSACTADLTDPTLGAEWIRATGMTDFQGTPADSIIRSMKVHWQPNHPPFLIGPAAVYGYWGGSIAVTGFAQLNFLAIPSNLLTGLS